MINVYYPTSNWPIESCQSKTLMDQTDLLNDVETYAHNTMPLSLTCTSFYLFNFYLFINCFITFYTGNQITSIKYKTNP